MYMSIPGTAKAKQLLPWASPYEGFVPGKRYLLGSLSKGWITASWPAQASSPTWRSNNLAETALSTMRRLMKILGAQKKG